MHEAGYAAADVDARYVTFEPAPASIAEAVRGADALGLTGLNVTIPFKRDVFEVVDPDPLASRIGAVNTIDFTGDGPTGHNTDAAGAIRALREHGGDADSDLTIDGSSAVVVGAGGAGRAIAFGLADAGASVSIANRTESRAHTLADEVPGASGHALDRLDDRLADADVLVNATSVGMETDRTPVPASALHADLVVMDAVYRPLETRLLREAADAGARTVDGAWMLLYQGTAAFERWLDRPAPVGAMNEALRAQL